VVTIAYVCLDDDALGLSAALALRQRTREQGIPIVVRTEQDAGLAMLMKGLADGGDGFVNLHAFGLLDRTCQPSVIVGGTHELIARALHEEYLRGREAQEPSFAADPAAVSWDELTEESRESCRRQADHIGVKMRAVECGIAPLVDWDAKLFQFTKDEVELMSRMEHDRWMGERLRDGWTRGPRNPGAKTNPNLVAWEELPSDVQEITRGMVRNLPAFLAGVDLQIHRPNQKQAG
jgi:hypothetical protein